MPHAKKGTRPSKGKQPNRTPNKPAKAKGKKRPAKKGY
jgi:hypothetical protein